MRTTDPHVAITALLESSDPSTFLQYDGTTYRVAPSESKREGFYEILTRYQLLKHNFQETAFKHESAKDLSCEELAQWLETESETWFHSAQYQASLAALSDHSTGD